MSSSFRVHELINRSPGYGLTLVTQSTTSAVHSAESLSVAGEVTTPEDIALFASRLLLEELSRGVASIANTSGSWHCSWPLGKKMSASACSVV